MHKRCVAAAFATLLGLAPPALAQAVERPVQEAPPFARHPGQVIVPTDPAERAQQDEWGYADAVIDGERVWLSGIVAGLRPGETLADQEAAYDRAFRRLASVLERAGSGLDGIVEMTTYHVDLPAQIEAFKQVKHRYVRPPFPAWTAIDIDRLVPDRGLVEIRVVARLRSAKE